MYWVTCRHCKAYGPSSVTDAKTSWNMEPNKRLPKVIAEIKNTASTPHDACKAESLGLAAQLVASYAEVIMLRAENANMRREYKTHSAVAEAPQAKSVFTNSRQVDAKQPILNEED